MTTLHHVLRSALGQGTSSPQLNSPIRQCQRPSTCIRSARLTAQPIAPITWPTAPITGRHHRQAACHPAASAAPHEPAQTEAAVAQPAGAAFIAWDLDNITVQHAAHLPLVARRLATAVERHCVAAGRQQHQLPVHTATQLAAYANERTLARFSGEGGRGGADAAARALALVGGCLVPVKTRRNAADSAMRSDMLAWARRPPADDSRPHSSAPLVVCVSGDTGFAGVLRYAAASCGASVAVVTDPLRTRKRPPWAPPPDYSRFPLPAAAGCCLVWDAAWIPDSPEQLAEEAALLAEWVQEGAVEAAPLPCPGGVTAAWRREGAGS